MLEDPTIRAVIILGPSDSGKYRLVLEATKARRSQTVVAIDPKSIAVKDLIGLESPDTDVIVIVENPNRDKLKDFVKKSKRSGKFKLLVTLSADDSASNLNFADDSQVKIIELAPLSKSQAHELLDSTTAKFDKRSKTRVVELANGDLDILLATATLGAGLTTESASISQKLINGAIKKLQSLCLLTEVGVKGSPYHELELICAEFGNGIQPASILEELPSLEEAGMCGIMVHTFKFFRMFLQIELLNLCFRTACQIC